MPIYEYRCPSCGRRTTLFFRSFREAEEQSRTPALLRCPHCQAVGLERLVSKSRLLRSAESRLDALGDGAMLDALDAEDPAAVAGLLRRTGAALGEEMDAEMSEIVDRLEAGESPADVGAALPDADPPPA